MGHVNAIILSRFDVSSFLLLRSTCGSRDFWGKQFLAGWVCGVVGRWVGELVIHVNASLLSKLEESSLLCSRNCGTRDFCGKQFFWLGG